MKICNYSEINDDFFKKTEFENISSVNEIIKAVQENGDEAIREYAKKFGDGDIGEFRLTDKEIQSAINNTDKKTIASIEYAINNVREFARAQYNSIKEIEVNINGNILGQKKVAIDSVGCYIPGGNYPLPSSAIMTIVPAKVAGRNRYRRLSCRCG